MELQRELIVQGKKRTVAIYIHEDSTVKIRPEFSDPVMEESKTLFRGGRNLQNSERGQHLLQQYYNSVRLVLKLFPQHLFHLEHH